MHVRQNLVSFHSANSKRRMRVVMLNATSLYRDKHCFYFSTIKKKNRFIHVRELYLFDVYNIKSEIILIYLIFPERRLMYLYQP